jgi:4-hydroxyphenylpyruvate dioxygenase
LRAWRTSGEQLVQRLTERGDPSLTDFAPLPKAPTVESVEFVEFAVTASESSASAALLEGLGVPRVARHRSKDVDLHRAGAVNFVLNRERESLAHSFKLLHGPAVCALALRVDNVEQTLERAGVIQCPAYFGRISPGEALIPAVGGVEGSLIYFFYRREQHLSLGA